MKTNAGISKNTYRIEIEIEKAPAMKRYIEAEIDKGGSDGRCFT